MEIDQEEIIYAITFKDLYQAIERRLGKVETLTLTPDDLDLAKEEVRAAIEHHLDEREFIEIGLDSWDISRSLTKGTPNDFVNHVCADCHLCPLHALGIDQVHRYHLDCGNDVYVSCTDGRDRIGWDSPLYLSQKVRKAPCWYTSGGGRETENLKSWRGQGGSLAGSQVFTFSGSLGE